MHPTVVPHRDAFAPQQGGQTPIAKADALLPTLQCAWTSYPPASLSLGTVGWSAAVLPARRRGVRWPHAPAVCAPPPLSCPPGSPFFSDQILQHRDVQCLI